VLQARGQSTEAACRLGLSGGAVKVAIHRLRKRFRDTVKAEIAGTVDEPSQAREELRYLIEVLAQPA
jgi:RNA polymerase sigma-70 factor (ECF subfamily)